MLAFLTALLLAAHPQVFFQQTDVGPLREAASGTHAEIATHIKTVLDAHLNDAAPVTTTYDDPRFHGNAAAVWAFGYVITGNVQYARKAQSLIDTYLGWSDWGFGETASLGGPDLNTAHMLLGVASAYDWIYDQLSATERTTIANRLGTEAAKMAAYVPNAWYVDEYVQNHNWIDTAALGVTGLALAGEDARAASWVTLAQGNLEKLKLSIGAIPDGSFHEGMPYQVYGLSMALPFWTALARTGVDLTDMGILRGFGKFWLYAQLPDNARQVALPYGDFTGWPTQGAVEILRYSASRFHDPLAARAARRWLDAGHRGTFLPEVFYDVFEFLYYDPTIPVADEHAQPLDGNFPDLGASVLHSTWNTGDLAVGFKAAPYGGHANFNRLKVGGAPGGWLAWGHDHNDDMSFWLYGSGTWLAPEAMGYDAGNNTGATYPANQTAFHNGLLIDGQGQLGDVRASDSNWNNPWFFNRDAQPITPTAGTAHYALTGAAGANLFDASVGPTRWDRLIALARGRYVLVRDDVAANAAHAFDWICHFQDGANVDTASGWIQGVGKNGQSLGVRVVSPAQWTASTGSQTATLMNLFDSDGQTAYVRVRPAAAAAQVQFLTALFPIATASWSQRPQVAALNPLDAGAGAVVAKGSPLEEHWIFARAGADGKASGDLALTQALVGVAAHDSSGTPLRAALFGAGKLSDLNGARELLSSQSAEAIEAELSGATLAVTGSGIADFRAFAPGVTSVTLNGAPVAVDFAANVATYPAAGAPPPPGGSGAPDAGTSAGTTSDGSASPPLAVAGVAPHTGCTSLPPAGWLPLAFAAALVAFRRKQR